LSKLKDQTTLKQSDRIKLFLEQKENRERGCAGWMGEEEWKNFFPKWEKKKFYELNAIKCLTRCDNCIHKNGKLSSLIPNLADTQSSLTWIA